MHVPGVLVLIAIVVICATVFETARIGWYLSVSKRLTNSIRKFEISNADATKRVLIVGDSTGYGTGTSDAAFSIGGRLAREFPEVALENYSKTGLKLHALLRVLKKANHTVLPGHFDLVIILCGGMNVVHYTPLSRMRRLLRRSLEEAAVLGKDVLLVIPHNPELPPMFRFPVSVLNGIRGRQASTLFTEIAAEKGVYSASLFGEASDVIFERNLYAPDKVHPNDEGYGIWYAAIRPILKEILTG